MTIRKVARELARSFSSELTLDYLAVVLIQGKRASRIKASMESRGMNMNHPGNHDFWVCYSLLTGQQPYFTEATTETKESNWQTAMSIYCSSNPSSCNKKDISCLALVNAIRSV